MSTTTVDFAPHHLPALPAGDYTVEVSQVLQPDRDYEDSEFATSRSFTIAGPRFTLDEGTVYTRFPPPGSLGDHSSALPHVSFRRSTLPWERTASADEPTATWLALLVFDEEEARRVMVSQTTKGAVVKGVDGADALNSAYAVDDGDGLEAWENEEDAVTVIEVPESVLAPLVPSLADLKLSAHVRSADGGEVAVLVANRLPAVGGTSTVHLVSLERQFAEGEDGSVVFSPPVHVSEDGVTTVHLVSLLRWEFSCVAAQPDFGGLLQALDRGADGDAALRLPDTGDDAADARVRRGYVPVNHSWREGGTLVSWMHGPLIPGERRLSDGETSLSVEEAWAELQEGSSSYGSRPYDLAAAFGLDLPALSSDALVRYQPDTGMLDASYAAAWELGKLLALRDKAFSVGLYAWKRGVIRALKSQKPREVWKYLPIYGGKPPEAYQLPEYQKSWLKSLARLEGVPFPYLVPHESMLPRESIRFFRTDPLWIACLLDGAFSMGRTLESDRVHDADGAQGPGSSLADFEYDVSGFLLRSQVVPGWPDLTVAGYDADDRPLWPLRQVRLGEQVLLCLFSRKDPDDPDASRVGELACVEISRKPESLHFGLDERDADDGGTVYEKALRRRDGQGPSTATLTVTPDASRVIRFEALAAAIPEALGETDPSALNSAELGFEMVDGVDAVRFYRA